MMGIPYQGWVEGVGFVLREVVVTAHATNRSRTQFFYDMQYTQTVVAFDHLSTEKKSGQEVSIHSAPLPLLPQNQKADELAWYSLASGTSAFVGAAAVPADYIGGSFRLTSGAKYGFQLSPKHYASGWRGGSAAGIKTFQLTNMAKGLGIASFVITLASSIGGIREYLEDPQSKNAVSPTKGTFDIGMGVYSLYFGGVGALYFLVDAFIGWDQVIGSAALVKQEEKQVMGETYYKWWYPRVQIH